MGSCQSMGSGANIIHPGNFDGMYQSIYIDKFFANHGRKPSPISMIILQI